MQKLIIANWKMHYGPLKAGAWIRAFRRERLPKEVLIGVAVPHVALAAARASLGRASVPMLGAQNVFWAEEGAFTGEVSPSMLKEFGTEFCLVGHSERRTHLGETDDMIAKKAAALQAAGVRPVICVGETALQRKNNETNKIVKAQTSAAIARLKGDKAVLPVIAYEPIWSVGSGKPCQPSDAQKVHGVIREILHKKFGAQATDIQIIYGGSVDVRNVADYLSTTHIDGALIGAASLDPRSFGLLCRTAVPR